MKSEKAELRTSDRRPVQLHFERMDFAAQGFKLFMIVADESFIPLLLQLFDLRFDFGRVDTFGVVMREGVNVQGHADRHDQMLFVELRITLDSFVFNARRDFAQLGHGFVFQFFVGVLSH